MQERLVWYFLNQHASDRQKPYNEGTLLKIIKLTTSVKLIVLLQLVWYFLNQLASDRQKAYNEQVLLKIIKLTISVKLIVLLHLNNRTICNNQSTQ